MDTIMEKKSYHHKNLRNDLIEKGIELVNENGIENLSLRKVAQACGVTHAAPYSHFSSKEELLAAMQEYITDQFTQILIGAIEKYKGTREFLPEFGKAYISFFIDKPQYFKFLFGQGNMNIDLSIDNINDNSYKPFAIYKSEVLELLDKSDMSAEKKQDLIIAMFSYIHGLTSLATMQNVKYDREWKEKITDLIMTFKY